MLGPRVGLCLRKSEFVLEKLYSSVDYINWSSQQWETNFPASYAEKYWRQIFQLLCFVEMQNIYILNTYLNVTMLRYCLYLTYRSCFPLYLQFWMSYQCRWKRNILNISGCAVCRESQQMVTEFHYICLSPLNVRWENWIHGHGICVVGWKFCIPAMTQCLQHFLRAK